MLRVLMPLFEPHFSARSYGFRPGAGIEATTYEQRKAIIEAPAGQMGVETAVLDHSVWLYMSNRSRGR
jgi:hypothetical protein